MKTNTNTTPVWLITGCSTDFGRSLAEHVLERGHRLVATARKPKELAERGDTLILPLDVNDTTQIAATIQAAEDRFGRIDVLVNNAGLGYFAAVEESEDEPIQRVFDINFHGVSRMIRAVLPGMRKRRSGHIVNITSIGGLTGVVAVGYYCAAKFAVEGLPDGPSLGRRVSRHQGDTCRTRRFPH
jgi:NAD(P)-dependent dehydrogenase (short-subunit alcohol dehydrogenase family)